jgi:hypothetical protein
VCVSLCLSLCLIYLSVSLSALSGIVVGQALPLETTLRVWDCLMLEGTKVRPTLTMHEKNPKQRLRFPCILVHFIAQRTCQHR